MTDRPRPHRYTEASTCDFTIPAEQAVGDGDFRYAPRYQSRRVDLREGAYAWYKLDGGAANSAGAPGGYPWTPSFPTVPSVSRSIDGTVRALRGG